METDKNKTENKTARHVRVDALVRRILQGFVPDPIESKEEWKLLQSQNPKNRKIHFTGLKKGDIVEPIGDVSWATAGNDVIIAITDDEFVLLISGKFSRKTGRALEKPFGYHL